MHREVIFMPLSAIDLIKAVKNRTVVSIDEPKKNSITPSEARFYLDFVTNKMKEYEDKKYPSPLYTYTKSPLAVDNRWKEATHITFSGAPVDEDKYLNTFEDNALIVRKLSIIAGILNALEFANLKDGFLGITNEKQLQTILDLLGEQLNIGGLLFADKTNINVFIKNLVTSISAITNTDPPRILSDIRTAERYFVADYKRDQILINEIKMDSGKSIFQVDQPLGNQLTADQRREFMSIHLEPEENRPLWFRGLSAWEQTWLRKHVPVTLNSSWTYFESLSQSSAMSHIPGIQNARMNSLVTFDGEHYKLLSRSLKTSTMVPYELHVTGNDRDFYVKQTAEQVLDYLHQEVTRDFDEIWAGLDITGRPHPLIFVQSLLSDTVIDRLVATADTRFTREQRKAIQEISLSGTYPAVTIVTGNDPMNFLRFGDGLSGGLSKKMNRWAHTDSILNYSKQFIAYLEQEHIRLNTEQVARLALIKNSKEEISNLRAENFASQGGRRNFVAFKAAYSSILVESMGGIVSTNCKSGKDRTGVEELYKNAMIYYYSIYGVLPKFDDEGVERKNFVDIFVLLFNSMKTQEAAAGNTPGSLGLKLDPTMLCLDIKAALSGTYTLSTSLASLNKPPLFIESETKSVKLRKVSISSFLNKTKPTDSVKQLEKDVDAYAQSHPIAERLLPFTSFRSSIVEYSSKPEMIPHLREHFTEIKDDIGGTEALAEIFSKFTDEVKGFITSFNQANPKLNAEQTRSMKQLSLLLQIIANGQELFFKSYDLMSTLQVLKYSTLDKLRAQFETHKQILLATQTNAETSSKAEASPRISDNPHTYFVASGSGKIQDFIRQYNELSKKGNTPIISPAPGGPGSKVK